MILLIKNKRNSLGINIYRELKQKIVTNEIIQGTLFYEVDISDQFNVSRTPVREAFRMLEAEGLLTITPRRGIQVTQISRENLLDAYEARIWIECSAVYKAATQITNKLLTHLEDILEKTPRNPVTHEDSVKFEKHNSMFHNLIVHSAGNLFANNFLEQIKMVTQRATYFVQPVRYQQSWAEHKELLDALKIHDAEKAERLTRYHIEKARDRLLG